MKLRFTFSTFLVFAFAVSYAHAQDSDSAAAKSKPITKKVIAKQIGVGTRTLSSPFQLSARSSSSRSKNTKSAVIDMRDTGKVSSGTDSNTALDINAFRSGATGGTIGTTGVDISVVGDTGGASTATGLLVNASGADKNYAAILRGGNVGIGVTAPDEVLHVDGRLHLEQTDAPTETADKLYNVGGTLYWNGSSVVGGGISDTTDSTLTRNGAGTGGSPYTLGLNLAAVNTWTGAINASATNTPGGSANAINIASTLGSMDGSDSFAGLNVDLTNADHSGSGNTVTGINISGITADAQATEYALQIGSGWDRAISATGSSVFTLGGQDVVLIDAATTDRTASVPGVLQIDFDSSFGAFAQQITVENKSTATSGLTFVAGLAVTPQQSGSGIGGVHYVVGEYISPVTASGALAGDQAQIGVYIGNQGAAGTESAVGLLIDAQSGSGSNKAAQFTGDVDISGTLNMNGTLDVANGKLLDLSDTIGGGGTSGMLLPQTNNCGGQTVVGQICWDMDDAILWVGNGASQTQINTAGSSSNGVEYILAHDKRVHIDGATTANDQTNGVLDLDARSSTDGFVALKLDTENTSAAGITQYGITNTVQATADVAGVDNSILVGLSNYVSKTGADTNTGRYDLYGASFAAANTGSGNFGEKNTIAAAFSAYGDNAGNSTAIGIVVSSGGADNIYSALFSSGNVGIGDDSPQALLTVGNPEKFTVEGSGDTQLAAGASLKVLNGAICVDDDGNCSSLTAGEVRADAFPTTGGDVAEMYPSNERLEPGDVVMLVGKDTVGKARLPYSRALFGIVSTEPGVILRSGEMFDDEARTMRGNTYAIGLVGRVPVKVSLENGPIELGDHLTSSSTPGVAMKATQSGPSLGIALESYAGGADESSKILCFAKLGEQNVTAELARIRQENAELKASIQELREEFENLRD